MTYHQIPTTHSDHKDGGGFFVGLLAGAAVGGGLALLFAPRQGAEVRHGLAESAQQAGRRLTQAYGSVAGSARRSARRFAGQDSGVREEQVTAPASGSTNAPATAGVGRDRADDPGRVIRDSLREAAYRPAAVEPSDAGPGSTSPAPPDSRSPLA